MDNQNLKDPNNPSGPTKINSYTVHVDRDLCIGAATCIAIAPQAFVLDNEAKAIILNTADTTPDETLIDAAKGCPTAAIIITGQNGEKIYPK